MSGLSWFPFYPGDYIRDTQQLSLLEHGVYLLLMNHYYSTGSLDCLIESSSNDHADDDRLINQTIDNSRIYRLCSAISEEEKKAVDVVLKLFFFYKKGKYVNKKIEKVITEQNDKHQKKVDAARIAVAAREQKKHSSKRSSSGSSNDHADDDETIIKRSSNQNQNQIIISSLRSEIKISDEFWEEFLEHRKKLKAPATLNSQKLLLMKLKEWKDNKGHDPIEILKSSMENGWKGVFEPKKSESGPQLHNNFKKQDYAAGTEGFELN